MNNLCLYQWLNHLYRVKKFYGFVSSLILISILYFFVMHAKVWQLYAVYKRTKHVQSQYRVISNAKNMPEKASFEVEPYQDVMKAWFKNPLAETMQQLLTTIKAASLSMYQMDHFLTSSHRKHDIKTMRLTLIGHYHALVLWLSHVSPALFYFKHLLWQRLPDGKIKLIVDIQLYYV
jgi:hypothetical protein